MLNRILLSQVDLISFNRLTKTLVSVVEYGRVFGCEDVAEDCHISLITVVRQLRVHLPPSGKSLVLLHSPVLEQPTTTKTLSGVTVTGIH